MKPNINLNAEIRKQKRLDRFDTNDPRCRVCGEDNHRCLEAHHIAGRKFADECVLICCNCHRKLSDMQRDHPAQQSKPLQLEEAVAHFLLGLADLFELLIRKFREFAELLLSDNSTETLIKGGRHD